jgi:hypothetical protein
MQTEIAKILELIGLGAPVIYAGAIFAFFAWLDKEASAEAKSAISRWLRPMRNDRKAVGTAILEMFDRIYTSPLFTWRAFGRSALISSSLTIIAALLQPSWTDVIFEPLTAWQGGGPLFVEAMIAIFVWSLLTNVLSDYFSLFFIRRWLAQKAGNPLLSLAIAAGIGFLIVYLFAVMRVVAADLSRRIILPGEGGWEGLKQYPQLWLYEILPRLTSVGHLKALLVLAAFAVHLWLVLFALSVILIKLANYGVRAISFMKWFLDKGNEHPIKALAYVSAAVVFVVAIAISILGRTLS